LHDSDAKLFSTENQRAIIKDALENLQTDAAQPKLWEIVYYVAGDLPVRSGLEDAVVSAISNLDLARFDGKLSACITSLYAAALQATSLRDPRLREHLSRQMLYIASLLGKEQSEGRTSKDHDAILASLMDVCTHLALSLPERQDEEFAHLLTELINLCPEAISFYRPVVEHLWPCSISQSRFFWPLLVRTRAFS